MATVQTAVKHLDWEDQTIFKDAVLGYINVPKAVAHELIDHKIFQRLHDIAQTGMESLYPGATHNRFCHSIGVYYLGKLAFQNFQQNVKNQHRDEIYYKVAGGDTKNDLEFACESVWNRWRFLFEMACLLHDCGHSPLSHSLEFLYDVSDSNTEADENNSEKVTSRLLLEAFQDSNFKDCFIKDNDGHVYGAPHERMSACLIVQDGTDGYRENLRMLIEDQVQYFNETSIYGRQLAPFKYQEEELLSDLEFMARAIIGCPYNSDSQFWGPENSPEARSIVYQLRNCIIHLLNGTIDVDNIDYSIRDATASGYKSAQVDYERLLKSHTIALAYEHATPLDINTAFFDYSVLLNRLELYADEAPLSMTLSGSATLVVRWDDSTAAEQEDGRPLGLQMTGNIIEADESSSSKTVRVIHVEDGSSARIELSRGRLDITPRDSEKENGAQLYIRSNKLTGRLTGTVFIGGNSSPDNGGEDFQTNIRKGKLKISSAYHKSALSVIQGALDATNFESRWIYSHHVTTYNNNFLSVFLLEKYAEFCYDEECCHLLSEVDRFLLLSKIFAGRGSTPDKKLQQQLKACFQQAATSMKHAQQRIDPSIYGSFPTELPTVTGSNDIEICCTLLQALGALCRIIPFSDAGSGRKKMLCSSVQRIIEAINILPKITVAEREPLELETEVYKWLRERIENHSKIRKTGMPYMSALLGMPKEQEVNGRKYYRISDADLRSMYHSLVNNTDKERTSHYKDLFDAIDQYESRSYLSPMWKSHAEFYFYVHGWKKEWFQGGPLSRIHRFFSSDSSPTDSDGTALYTYFSEQSASQLSKDLQEFWSEAKERFFLDILIYVPQKIRHKKLKADKTYVIWKNRIVTLKDIGLQTSQANEHKYFYLYYHRKKDAAGELDVPRFMDFLREWLDNWKIPEAKEGVNRFDEKRTQQPSGTISEDTR